MHVYVCNVKEDIWPWGRVKCWHICQLSSLEATGRVHMLLNACNVMLDQIGMEIYTYLSWSVVSKGLQSQG